MISINKNLFFNIFSSAALAAINFFTIPIFSSILGADQYGMVEVYKTWVRICSIFFGLQIHGSIGPAMAFLNEEEIPNYFSSILAFGLLISLTFILLGAMVMEFLSEFLLMTHEEMALLAIQSMAMVAISFSAAAFIFRKKAHWSCLIQVGASLLGAVGSFYCIEYWFPPDKLYLGSIYGGLIPLIIIAIIVTIYFLHFGNYIICWKYIRFCLPVCLPLIVHGLAGIILGQCDRILLQRMIGNAEAGIYSFAVVFSNVLLTIWTALNNSWLPYYFDDLKNNKSYVIREKSKNYIFLYDNILIVFILWAPEVIRLFMPKDFYLSISLIPFLVSSIYFHFLYSFPVNYQFYCKETRAIACGTILAAVVNFILDWLVIPVWGITGAAVTTLISQILLFLFHEFIAERILVNYHYSLNFFFPGMLHILLAVVISVYFQECVWLRWGLGIGSFLIFCRDIYVRKSFF